MSDSRPQIPAMVNVHSHAFQRDMRGAAERISASSATDDFWSWRKAMFDTVAELDPDGMHAGRAGRLSRDGATPAMAPSASSTTSTTSRTARLTRNRTRWRSRWLRPRREAGLEIVLLPAAYHRNGWRDGADVPAVSGQRRFCDPDVESFLSRVDELRAWAARHTQACSVGVAAHSVRAVPASWLAAIAQYSDANGLVRHVHAQEQPQELEQCQAEHGCSPLELLDSHGFPRVEDHRGPRDPRERPRCRASRATRVRSSPPAPQPRPTSVTVSCRRCATATPACG